MDRNINEKIRKPRRSTGTPFHTTRNWLSLGIIGASGLFWYFYELWPQTHKLRARFDEGDFQLSEEVQDAILSFKVQKQNPEVRAVFEKLKKRKEEKDEAAEPKKQPWFVKIFTSTPDFSKQTETISKYFVKTTPENGEEAQADITSDYLEMPSCSSETLTNKIVEESPYKNLQLPTVSAEELDTSLSDDFTSPKRVKLANLFKQPENKPKQTKSKKKVTSNRGKRSSTRSKGQSTLRKILSDNFGSSDVDGNDLQMALALSKSVQQDVNVDMEKEDDITDCPSGYPSTQEKIAEIKRTLDQFGFTSDKSKLEVERKRLSNFVMPTKKKKSRFKFVRPSLILTSQKERENLISQKVAIILQEQSSVSTQISTEYSMELTSRTLKTLNDERRKLYKLNSLLEADLKIAETFYVEEIDVSPSKSKCGILLKDWSKIPGRDRTPPRALTGDKPEELMGFENVSSPKSSALVYLKNQNETDKKSSENVDKCLKATKIMETEENCTKSEQNNEEKPFLKVKTLSSRSLTPDLFESDEEMPVESHSSVNFQENASKIDLKIDSIQENLSLKIGNKSLDSSEDDLFQNEKGICHYESYLGDTGKTSQVLYDLTHSSDEEDIEEKYEHVHIPNNFEDKKTPKNNDEETSKNYREKEGLKTYGEKETSKHSEDEETSKIYEYKESLKNYGDKETLKDSEDEETSKNYKFKETSKNYKVKESSRNYKDKETLKNYKHKDTTINYEEKDISNNSKDKETSKNDEEEQLLNNYANKEISKNFKDKGTSNNCEEKETSKNYKDKKTSKNYKGKQISNNYEDKGASNKCEDKETSKNYKGKKTSKNNEHKETSKNYEEKLISNNYEDKELLINFKDKETSKNYEEKETSKNYEEKETSINFKDKKTSKYQEHKETSKNYKDKKFPKNKTFSKTCKEQVFQNDNSSNKNQSIKQNQSPNNEKQNSSENEESTTNQIENNPTIKEIKPFLGQNESYNSLQSNDVENLVENVLIDSEDSEDLNIKTTIRSQRTQTYLKVGKLFESDDEEVPLKTNIPNGTMRDLTNESSEEDTLTEEYKEKIINTEDKSQTELFKINKQATKLHESVERKIDLTNDMSSEEEDSAFGTLIYSNIEESNTTKISKNDSLPKTTKSFEEITSCFAHRRDEDITKERHENFNCSQEKLSEDIPINHQNGTCQTKYKSYKKKSNDSHISSADIQGINCIQPLLNATKYKNQISNLKTDQILSLEPNESVQKRSPLKSNERIALEEKFESTSKVGEAQNNLKAITLNETKITKEDILEGYGAKIKNKIRSPVKLRNKNAQSLLTEGLPSDNLSTLDITSFRPNFNSTKLAFSEEAIDIFNSEEISDNKISKSKANVSFRTRFRQIKKAKIIQTNAALVEEGNEENCPKSMENLCSTEKEIENISNNNGSRNKTIAKNNIQVDKENKAKFKKTSENSFNLTTDVNKPSTIKSDDDDEETCKSKENPQLINKKYEENLDLGNLDVTCQKEDAILINTKNTASKNLEATNYFKKYKTFSTSIEETGILLGNIDDKITETTLQTGTMKKHNSFSTFDELVDDMDNYEETEPLNVTDYIKDLLSKENYNFENSKRYSSLEKSNLIDPNKEVSEEISYKLKKLVEGNRDCEKEKLEVKKALISSPNKCFNNKALRNEGILLENEEMSPNTEEIVDGISKDKSSAKTNKKNKKQHPKDAEAGFHSISSVPNEDNLCKSTKCSPIDGKSKAFHKNKVDLAVVDQSFEGAEETDEDNEETDEENQHGVDDLNKDDTISNKYAHNSSQESSYLDDEEVNYSSFYQTPNRRNGHEVASNGAKSRFKKALRKPKNYSNDVSVLPSSEEEDGNEIELKLTKMQAEQDKSLNSRKPASEAGLENRSSYKTRNKNCTRSLEKRTNYTNDISILSSDEEQEEKTLKLHVPRLGEKVLQENEKGRLRSNKYKNNTSVLSSEEEESSETLSSLVKISSLSSKQHSGSKQFDNTIGMNRSISISSTSSIENDGLDKSIGNEKTESDKYMLKEGVFIDKNSIHKSSSDNFNSKEEYSDFDDIPSEDEYIPLEDRIRKSFEKQKTHNNQGSESSPQEKNVCSKTSLPCKEETFLKSPLYEKTVHDDICNYDDFNEDFPGMINNHFENPGDSMIENKINTPLSHQRIEALSRENTPNFRSKNASDVLEDSLDQVVKRNSIYLSNLEDVTSKILLPNYARNNRKNNEENHRKNSNFSTPPQHSRNGEDVSTPGVIIRTENVTPMPNFEKMSTPIIVRELQKYGLKPLKRKRGLQMLKYIYEATHPDVSTGHSVTDISSEEKENTVKKRRSNNDGKCKRKLDEELLCVQSSSSCNISSINERKIEICPDILSDSDMKNLIFERRKSAKIHSCGLPLQIAFHNLISLNPDLKENILMYEPIQLDVLHTMLKEQGFKYHIEDLLTFLDKKCITIRTNQNQGHGKRKRY